ncbi:MAG: WXG100 family type VII secretion target [Mycoplasmatales bacterium]
MSGQIRLSGEEMRGRAAEYRSHSEDLKSQINAISQMMSALQDEWHGQASKSFNDQFESLKPSFVQMSDLLATLGQQLDQAAQIMEETDQKIASQFGL